MRTSESEKFLAHCSSKNCRSSLGCLGRLPAVSLHSRWVDNDSLEAKHRQWTSQRTEAHQTHNKRLENHALFVFVHDFQSALTGFRSRGRKLQNPWSHRRISSPEAPYPPLLRQCGTKSTQRKNYHAQKRLDKNRGKTKGGKENSSKNRHP